VYINVHLTIFKTQVYPENCYI